MDSAIKIILALCLFAQAAAAATNAAASASQEDIQAAVNISTHGDTVTIPAGSNAITTQIIVTNFIRMIGAGTNDTILVDELTSRSQHPIRFYLTNSSINYTALLANMQLKGGAVNTAANQGFVMVQGSAWRTNAGPYGGMRLTGLLWNEPNGRPAALYAFGNILVDSNVLHTHTSGFLVHSAAPNSTETGHGSWAADADYGGWQGKAYFEGNTVYRHTGGGIVDGWGGARYVVRYNWFTNVSIHNHGTDSSGQFRSCRLMEIYGNSFRGLASELEYAIHSRGGSGVIFSNSVATNSTVYPGLFRMADYRASFNGQLPFGPMTGENLFDENDNTVYATGTHTGTNDARVLIDTNASFTPSEWVNAAFLFNTNSGRSGFITANTATSVTTASDTSGVNLYWTNGNTYRIRKVIRAFDGNGRGQGALLTGFSSSTPPTPQAWPNQTDEGWYIWGNSGKTNVTQDSQYWIREGQEFFIETAKPGYTPLAYPHPLAATGGGGGGGYTATAGNVTVQGNLIIQNEQ